VSADFTVFGRGWCLEGGLGKSTYSSILRLKKGDPIDLEFTVGVSGRTENFTACHRFKTVDDPARGFLYMSADPKPDVDGGTIKYRCSMREVGPKIVTSTNQFERMLRNTALHDVKLITTDATTISANKAVLAGCSEVFEMMMASKMKESTDGVIELQLDAICTQVLVQYCYGASTTCISGIKSWEQCYALIQAADMYALEGLMAAVVDAIQPYLSKHTIYHTLQLAARLAHINPAPKKWSSSSASASASSCSSAEKQLEKQTTDKQTIDKQTVKSPNESAPGMDWPTGAVGRLLRICQEYVSHNFLDLISALNSPVPEAVSTTPETRNKRKKIDS
jgi:hypothetical protein